MGIPAVWCTVVRCPYLLKQERKKEIRTDMCDRCLPSASHTPEQVGNTTIPHMHWIPVPTLLLSTAHGTPVPTSCCLCDMDMPLRLPVGIQSLPRSQVYKYQSPSSHLSLGRVSPLCLTCATSRFQLPCGELVDAHYLLPLAFLVELGLSSYIDISTSINTGINIPNKLLIQLIYHKYSNNNGLSGLPSGTCC